MSNASKRPKINTDRNLVARFNARFHLEGFWYELRHLDRQNCGSWPLVIKGFIIVSLLLLIAVFGYQVPIKNTLFHIQAAQAQQQVLLQTYQLKQTQARDLQTHKAQLLTLESRLVQLFVQMPEATASDLVDSIHHIGINSGLHFQDISIASDVEQTLFIEQPIHIVATGQYHQLGQFMSELVTLPRMMSLHDFEVSRLAAETSVLPELTLVLQAKTYRAKSLPPVIAVSAAASVSSDSPQVDD